MQYLGDLTEGQIIDLKFSTVNASNAPTSLTSGAVSVYKANGATQTTAGITLTTDFDSVTGMHHVRIDTSADAFYATANDYQIVLTGGTVDGVSVVGSQLATFSIENRNIKANATHWGGTAVASASVRSNVIEVGGSAVVSSNGVIAANVVQISNDATAADNAEAFFDGTGYAGTNNVIPTVTTVVTVTNLINAPTNGDLTATMKASVQTAVEASSIDVDEEAIADEVADALQGQLGQTQPRINRKPDPGFTTQVSRRSDGTYKCIRPIRLTAGTISNVYVFIDMSPLFGVENFVETVGTLSVSAGSITAGADRGPRDTYAVLELDGTADDDCEVTVSVTMESGTTVDVVFDVEVLGG